ncbi:hypothetical protein EVAR_85753_1 [Eumeta japonica]|uniref:Uncharacterized protein n=1 Tax=Eumeta variegata TaxID=151549 RepID=A0A4C1ZFP1_EUMVA|nr:hypothetical protein EVAR_85753_1 [Eumeta japonica]
MTDLTDTAVLLYLSEIIPPFPRLVSLPRWPPGSGHDVEEPITSYCFEDIEPDASQSSANNHLNSFLFTLFKLFVPGQQGCMHWFLIGVVLFTLSSKLHIVANQRNGKERNSPFYVISSLTVAIVVSSTTACLCWFDTECTYGSR